MPNALIIVESPAKARTLKRFLGDRFEVRASMGHVRDLPERELAVDVEGGFQPRYQVVESRQGTIKDLKSALPKNGDVILASDPDREGEAIAWHLSEVLKLRSPKRIEFHEITSDAVRRALDHPRQIDMHLVNAQQARRVLDRLVGYRLSPFLWKKVRKGISAGRVQSVALRLVCDREQEIRVFTPVESWTIDALLSKLGDPVRFKARLIRRRDDKPGAKLDLGVEADAKAVLEQLRGASYRVTKVDQRQRSKNPPAPYITSTLQQDASTRLRMGPKKTMRIAQDLYEGVDIGASGPTGLITYMRTDSTRVSEEADARARNWIRSELGPRYLGKARQERSRPGAQDAHEAIRPTDPARRPEDVRQFLKDDQYRLYDLIWRRFVASRMHAAEYAITQAEISAGDFVFRASGSVVTFDGFNRVWQKEDREEKEARAAANARGDADDDVDESRELPPLRAGESLRLHRLEPEQHFTQPPPRYSEASLIRELEERGIGRPSTYATIVGTIQERGYVKQAERRLQPTDLGEEVNRMMVAHFTDIVDDKYTAAMEQRLDDVEQGRVDWVPVVGDFYLPLERMLSAAEEAIPADTGEICPQCGEGHLILKASKYGAFKGCSRYPACKYRAAATPAGQAGRESTLLDETCPECGRQLQKKRGRYGEFVGCSGYPECKYVRRDDLPEPKPTGQTCPQCGKELVERRGRYGTFLACSGYPECRYRANPSAAAGTPRPAPTLLDEPCPVCGKPMVERRGRFGMFKSCSDYPRCKGPKGAPAAKGRQRGRARGAAEKEPAAPV